MRPNILVVITHDTGRHLGVYDRGVATPNLERLAQQGVVFDHAFCAAPQCSPSRASLLTGQVPHSHGLIGLTHRGFRLRPESYERTLPAVLARAGYATLLFGFQHEAPDPRQLGYQSVAPVDPVGRHRSRVVTPSVVSFLESRPSEPFFAMVGFSETHRPFELTATPLDSVRVPAYLPDVPIIRRDVADLNEQVRHVDDAIGLIDRALDRSGLAARTLFIFTTDHGIAFPGAKGSLFDPGLEISLVARGPDGFSGGRRLPGLVSNVDLYATILDLCGVALPTGTHGISQLAVVRGERESLRDEIFSELTYHASYDPMRGIRTRRYNYIRSFADRPYSFPPHVDDSPTKDYLRGQGYFERRRPPELLFDLDFDPFERSNLVGDPGHQHILASLRARLDDWLASTDDPLLLGDVPPPPGAVVTPIDSYSP